ncbi:MAG: hypothetical protein C4522_14405 [Desulfobacteraceae bacterium]|nr:MAG: hypothetical protein C4522_14405 [Desulfobacteraceae bacterium]
MSDGPSPTAACGITVGGEQPMTSKTFQIKLIRKNKKRAHKANRKADQKRIVRNQEILSKE